MGKFQVGDIVVYTGVEYAHQYNERWQDKDVTGTPIGEIVDQSDRQGYIAVQSGNYANTYPAEDLALAKNYDKYAYFRMNTVNYRIDSMNKYELKRAINICELHPDRTGSSSLISLEKALARLENA